MNEIAVHGLSDIRDFLQRRLPESLHGKVLNQALTKGTKLIVDEARRLSPESPFSTGNLKKSIYHFKSRKSTRTHVMRGVTVRSGKKKGKHKANYWIGIEFGQGEIKRKEGTRSLGTPAKGWFGDVVRARRASPFMRPAFESKKAAAVEAFRLNLKPVIEKVAAKYYQKQQSKLLIQIRKKAFGI